MDLNNIAAFVQVVQAGSFTKASVELGLPKSSVSRRVAALEESLGVQLLQRTTRALTLTEAGREYFAQAGRGLAAVNEAANAVSRLGKEPRGVVRVTAPMDLGTFAMADTLARFSAKYPRIHIDLSLTGRRVDLIAEGFDVALRAASRLTDSSLIATKVGSTDFGVFASREYLERRGIPRSPRELAQHSCILFHARNGETTWNLKGPKGEESVAVKGPLNVDELLFVIQAVEAGMGIGLVPMAGLIGTKSSAQALVRLLPDYAAMSGSLFVVTPAIRHRPARVTLFCEFLIKSLRALNWVGPVAQA